MTLSKRLPHSAVLVGRWGGALFRSTVGRYKLAFCDASPNQPTHPAGVGPMRVSASEPESPALLPPVKLYASVALEQLLNTKVALPTATVTGAGTVGVSNTPPVVW